MGSKLETFKKIALPVTELIVSSGVTLVCNAVLKENLPEQDKKLQKTLMNIGTWAISSYVGTTVTEHVVSQVNDKIDQTEQTADQLVAAVESIKRRKEANHVDVEGNSDGSK